MVKDNEVDPGDSPEEFVEEYFPEPREPSARAEIKELEADAEEVDKAGASPSIEEAEKEAAETSPKANIIVIGETGVGKSTLINAAFREGVAKVGVGKPVTSGIELHEAADSPVRLYDTPGLELSQDPHILVDGVQTVIDDGVAAGPDHHLHLAWFCLPGSGGLAFQDSTKVLISDIGTLLPTFLVATQVPDVEDPELLSWLTGVVVADSLGVVDDRAFCLLAEPLKTVSGTVASHGVEELVQRSLEVLPEAQRRAFAGALKATEPILSIQATEARKVVLGASAAAATIGATPVPVAGSAAILFVQRVMAAKINVAFGVDREDPMIDALMQAFTAENIMAAGGKMASAQLVKLVPGAGSLVAGAVNAGVAGVLTLAMGEAYIRSVMEIKRRRMRGEEIPGEEIVAELKKHLDNIDVKELKKLLDDLRGRR